MAGNSSGPDLQSILVRDPDTGLLESHVIVAFDDLGAAGSAILPALESVVARHRGNPSFSGRILFVVRGPDPDTPFPPALAEVQSQIDARLAAPGMRTAAGRPFVVKIEYSESPF
jgi:hypothetical protein